MGTLGEATDFLLRCNTPADWIELADGYMQQAVAWLESEYPALTTDQKKLWVKRLEQLCMKQRRAWLTGHRKQRGTRLTLDEQRQVLDEFWADVDDNTKQGNLPKYE